MKGHSNRNPSCPFFSTFTLQSNAITKPVISSLIVLSIVEVWVMLNTDARIRTQVVYWGGDSGIWGEEMRRKGSAGCLLDRVTTEGKGDSIPLKNYYSFRTHHGSVPPKKGSLEHLSMEFSSWLRAPLKGIWFRTCAWAALRQGCTAPALGRVFSALGTGSRWRNKGLPQFFWGGIRCELPASAGL